LAARQIASNTGLRCSLKLYSTEVDLTVFKLRNRLKAVYLNNSSATHEIKIIVLFAFGVKMLIVVKKQYTFDDIHHKHIHN